MISPSAHALALLAGLAVFLPAAASAQSEAPDLYARVEQRLSAEPALADALGRPAAEMAEVQWLLGEWHVEAAVASAGGDPPERGISTVTPLHGGVWLEVRDTYPTGVQDLSYLGYNPATRRWSTVGLDSYGNANILSAPGWVEDRLVFEGDALVIGLAVRLRQTMIREGADAYRVDNEEWVGGEWKLLDSYRYTRRTAS
jgi:hypothetical protein